MRPSTVHRPPSTFFNIDAILFKLFCLFALLVPFEHILEVFFDIETVFKPYRVVSLLIIALYGIKLLNGKARKLNFSRDLPLYLIFVYGIIVSLVQMTTGRFSMKLFNNDLFQIGLYLITFFIFQNTQLTKNQWLKVFWSLTAGICLNAFYLFNAFFFLGNYGRQGGFMNNPNYVALSITVAVAFLIYRLSAAQKTRTKLLSGALILFLLFVFPVTGSRSGLAILAVIGLLTFFFASLRSKLITVAAGLGLLFFFVNQNSEKFNVGALFVLTNRLEKKQNVEDVRIPVWRNALLAGEKVWFTGIGIGQFKAQFSKLMQNEYHDQIVKIVQRGAHLSIHSDYIGLLVIYGIPGLLLYLYYLAKLALTLLRNMRFATDKPLRRFYQFNLMVLFSIAVFGLSSENFLSPLYWVLFALLAAALQVFLPAIKVQNRVQVSARSLTSKV